VKHSATPFSQGAQYHHAYGHKYDYHKELALTGQCLAAMVQRLAQCTQLA